jgi:ribonuclease HI
MPLETVPNVPVIHPPASWEAPKQDFVKVNFDAAFQETSHSGAWGFVLRSDQGFFLAGAAGKIEHAKSALHDEAIACVAVIDVSSRLGVYRVMFESDSSTLVHALKTLTYDLSEIGVLLRDAKSTCTLHFDVF